MVDWGSVFRGVWGRAWKAEKAMSATRASTQETEDRRLPQEHALKKARNASFLFFVLQIRGLVRFLVGNLSWYYGAACVESRDMNGT